jgi:hypothetical protein
MRRDATEKKKSGGSRNEVNKTVLKKGVRNVCSVKRTLFGFCLKLLFEIFFPCMNI